LFKKTPSNGAQLILINYHRKVNVTSQFTFLSGCNFDPDVAIPSLNLTIFRTHLSNLPQSGFGGPGVSVLASGTGFKPGRSRRIFKGGKILSTPSFGREVKPWVPCREICGMSKIPKCTVEVGIMKNLPVLPRPQVPTSAASVRNASVGAGASGGQSWNVQSWRYNKPVSLQYTDAHGNKQTNLPQRGGQALCLCAVMVNFRS
jgi:hypothetical protein